MTAVCRRCDSRIWRAPHGKIWYVGQPGSIRRTVNAICQADGGRHQARRGSVIMGGAR